MIPSTRRLVGLLFVASSLPMMLVGCGGRPDGREAVGAASDSAQALGIVAYSRRITSADLTVAGTGGITGIARRDSGAPRPNARITLGETSESAGETDLDVAAAVVAAVRTGPTGRYGFANVPPGRWRVRYRDPDRTISIQVLRVRSGGIGKCTFGGDRTVTDLIVRPGQATVAIGETRQFRVVGYNAAGHLVTGFTTVWRTLNRAVAGVSAYGVVRGRSAGQTRVEASVGGVFSRARVTVTGAGGDLTNLFFLHHSTGDGIIVQGNVRGHIAGYNSSHSTTFEFWDHGYNYEGLRDPSGSFTGTSYNIPGDNTDPDGLHWLWTGSGSEAVQCRNRILDNHQVIAFKSCFPASAIWDAARLNEYKAWYLDIRDFFDTRNDRVFVVMSTPPLHRLSTNRTEAKNARRFANWLKSSTYLSGHPNVVCFDLFDLLAAPDDGSPRANMLRYQYEKSHSGGDSHPNNLADQTVGPLFAQALIDAALSH